VKNSTQKANKRGAKEEKRTPVTVFGFAAFTIHLKIRLRREKH